MDRLRKAAERSARIERQLRMAKDCVKRMRRESSASTATERGPGLVNTRPAEVLDAG